MTRFDGHPESGRVERPMGVTDPGQLQSRILLRRLHHSRRRPEDGDGGEFEAMGACDPVTASGPVRSGPMSRVDIAPFVAVFLVGAVAGRLVAGRLLGRLP